MAYVTDGEIWVQEEFAKDTAGSIGSNGGRTYRKSNAGLALVCFYRSSDSNYTDPMIISNTSTKAAYSPYGSVNTVVVDGVTWYYCTGGGMGNLTPTTDFPFLNFKDGVLPTVNYDDVPAWIIGQGYIMNRPPVPTFYVSYDPNGGTGTMDLQNIEIDTPTPLSLCSFTREEYSFAGWSRTAGGPVEFQDGEIVENLAGDGETVELFAVWAALPPRFLLQFNPTDNEHLDKDLQTVHDLRGYFRDGCSVEDPVVLLAIDPADLAGVNYFTIPALRRGYFLTGQTVVRTGLVEISGHVDVLSSFATEIRQQRAIVRRAQSPDAYNLYLNDGSLKSYQNPYILTELFPNGFIGNSFVLSVAGNIQSPTVITIVQQPVNYTGAIGDNATFTVVATGPQLQYQWQVRTTPSGAWRDVAAGTGEQPTYTSEITTARLAYSFRCKVYNNNETVYSDVVRMIQS